MDRFAMHQMTKIQGIYDTVFLRIAKLWKTI